MQDAAMPVAIAFSSIEFVSFVLLSVVFFRLNPGIRSFHDAYTVESALILICCLVSFASWIYATETDEYPVAVFAFAQFLSDCAMFFLIVRAAKNKLRRCIGSIWRGVLSCATGLMSVLFITDDADCRAFLITTLVLRSLWIMEPIIVDRMFPSKAVGVVDEWGLITNRLSTLEGAVVATSASSSSMRSALLPAFRSDDDFDNDEDEEARRADVRSESIANSVTFARASSTIPPPPIASSSRNTSESTTDSVESLPLVRPPSVHGVVWGSNLSSAMLLAARPADDAAGPVDTRAPLEMLPETVRVISFREVLTTGGVPLIVYVLLTDRNEICVHRYGEFRALCNRIVSRFFQESAMEAPPFPGRRVFRKLLPQAMGGVVQGAAADREFIASRAAGLSEWIQKVVDAVRAHPESEPTVLALVDFLRPICHFADNADQEQVIQTAVMVFSETVLNPTVLPPSPCM